MTSIYRASFVVVSVLTGCAEEHGDPTAPLESVIDTAAAVMTLHHDTAFASAVGGTLASDEVLQRAQYWVDRGFTYSQSRSAPDSNGRLYRTDCSGLVSNAWHLTSSLLTNEFLSNARANAAAMRVISLDELMPGDAIVRDNDGFGPDGHMELFAFWRNDADHHQGAYVYSFNTSGETVQNPYANSNFGHLGLDSWSELTTYTAIRYTNVSVPGGGGLGVLDFFLSDDPTSNVNTRAEIHYGNSPMVPIVGDWNGDGVDTVSTYDPTSGWFFLSNDPATGAHQYAFPYGNPGAVPLVGDWDGDGKDNVGVRMGTTFYLRMSAVTDATEITSTVAYGDTPDVPLVGDWDGDGKDNIGVYKAQLGWFYLRMTANDNPTETTITVAYGNANATPLVGDWNDDGRDNIGVRMDNIYYFRTSEVTDAAEITASVAYGNGDGHELPIIGDWDGDGIDTQGIVF
jgi:hypothetical protein